MGDEEENICLGGIEGIEKMWCESRSWDFLGKVVGPQDCYKGIRGTIIEGEVNKLGQKVHIIRKIPERSTLFCILT